MSSIPGPGMLGYSFSISSVARQVADLPGAYQLKVSDEQVFQKRLLVESVFPGIKLPVFGREQFAGPTAIEAGGAHGIYPLFKRDASAARPHVAAVLGVGGALAVLFER